jgi:hypothetical protein
VPERGAWGMSSERSQLLSFVRDPTAAAQRTTPVTGPALE